MNSDFLGEIHPTRNALSLEVIEKLTNGSPKKIWWLCDKGHEWETEFRRRVAGSKCPYCMNNKVLVGFNDLKTNNPILTKEWNYQKNSFSPEEITPGSNKKVHWLCNEGHEWEAIIAARTKGDNCPYCGKKKLMQGFNDLETLNKNIAAQWHPTKNGKITPKDIIDGSHKKYWWQCEKGHEWEISASRRTNGSACPFCLNQKLLEGFNDLATTHPDIAAQWHPTKNGSKSPKSIIAGTHQKIWWKCDKGHEWEAVVNSRSYDKKNCPYCSNNKIIEGYNDFSHNHPALLEEWDYVKNNKIKPTEITSGSSHKVWWTCDKEHEWKTSVNKRVNEKQNCPYCANKKVYKGFNDLTITEPELIKEWHPTKNGKLYPDAFLRGSKKRIWWLGKCGHEWEATIMGRAVAKNNCLICAGYLILKGFNDLESQRPDIASEWHPTLNDPLSPEKIAFRSNQKVWWLCDKGHEWQTIVSDRVRTDKRKINCTVCAGTQRFSQDERLISKWLESFEDFTVSVNNRKILSGIELDIYIPERNIAIEYNGVYWHSEKFKSKTYHYDKWLACKNAGIQLIQIWEDDWNRNPEQVKRMLAHKLGLGKEPTVYARNTTVKHINKNQAEDFLAANHVQGFASGSYYLGLFDKRDIEKLVAVLILKKEAGTNGKTLNIIRYATSQNVVGGFTKLLSYAEKTYEPDSFITFSDNCVSDGGLYENNGFTADKILKPDYTYLVNGKRKHKFGYRLKRFSNDPELQYQPGLTERELAALNGLHRVWDAGKTRWIKNILQDTDR